MESMKWMEDNILREKWLRLTSILLNFEGQTWCPE